MALNSIAVINDILPKLIAEGQNNIVAQARFLKEINKARETNRINPTGLYKPYTIDENNTGYGVAEGGPILGGGRPEYAMTNVGLRAHWATLEWTGQLERIKDQFLTQLKRNNEFQQYNDTQLQNIARNFAIRDQVQSTLKMYARRENFYALQGASNSAIGVVTSIADIATNKLYFDANTTSIGSRMFGKGQQVEFRDGAGVRRDLDLAAGYGTVSTRVARSTAGAVQFDDIDQNIIVGDTAHLRNSYALMPEGVPSYIDDTGDFRGLARSTNPDVLSSVMLRLTGSPAFTPVILRELLSKMQSKMGYDVPFELVFWMCKTQLYNFETFVYSTIVRQVDAGAVKNADLSIDEVSWSGRRFNIDVDVPPDQVDALNMMSWQNIVQTPMQAYPFDSGQYVKSLINSDGQYLDSRMSVVFGEHNWVCDDPRSNGIVSGLAFNPDLI
jgi:hypothetical protein